ncbi:MAG: tripartite tricarboxylate transporter permease [Sphaerochaetaceae bacterium]|nr:tripartite tricarboxylate transporter permease [Sphaerochaetaceae bacterium]
MGIWIEVIQSILTPGVLLYLLFGVLIGSFLGSLPGLTATMGIAILTPITFWFAPAKGFAMLIGVWNSAIWAGGISAILVNTPGTPASIATTFDGFTMTNNGKAKIALQINTVFSVFGGIFGTLVLMVAAFPLAKFAIKFGPAEYFMVGLFGLSMMISVSGNSILKGAVLGFLGLLVATIGLDPMVAAKRFTFGNINLLLGVSFIPVMIGMFGVGEILYQVSKSKSMNFIEKNDEDDDKTNITEKLKLGDESLTIKDCAKLTPISLFCSLISAIVGAIPAAGGDIASIICWGQAKRLSKHPEEFGKGSKEGLTASCVGNNGVLGGALTTMLTLGIPGDAATAILIGSLMMYGMQPGPRMFVEDKSFVITIMILMIFANLLILIYGLTTSKIFIKLLKVKKPFIWVTVLVLCMVGSYALNNSMFDVVVMLLAGGLGFFFKRMDYAPGPFVLGLLLGKIIESNLRRALSLTQGSYNFLYTHPIVIVLEILVLIAIIGPFIKKKQKNQI